MLTEALFKTTTLEIKSLMGVSAEMNRRISEKGKEEFPFPYYLFQPKRKTNSTIGKNGSIFKPEEDCLPLRSPQSASRQSDRPIRESADRATGRYGRTCGPSQATSPFSGLIYCGACDSSPILHDACQSIPGDDLEIVRVPASSLHGGRRKVAAVERGAIQMEAEQPASEKELKDSGSRAAWNSTAKVQLVAEAAR
jgi:hypothetical protein